MPFSGLFCQWLWSEKKYIGMGFLGFLGFLGCILWVLGLYFYLDTDYGWLLAILPFIIIFGSVIWLFCDHILLPRYQKYKASHQLETTKRECCVSNSV